MGGGCTDSDTIKRTPKNLICPHCGKEISNAVDERILAALQGKASGLSWNLLLETTKVSKGALSGHLNSLIKKGTVKVIIEKCSRDRLYKVN